MRLGSYTTMDCPTDKLDDAFTYLKTEFNLLDASVQKILNPHDFGDYPSFEIDYPDTIINHENICPCGDCEMCECQYCEKSHTEKDIFHDKANAIEKTYGEKFSQWL